MTRKADIAIVGAGPVGLSLARALADSGLALALVESQAPRDAVASGEQWDSRVYALSPGCAAFLERWRTRCVANGIDYVRVTTDMALDTALREYLVQRTRGVTR